MTSWLEPYVQEAKTKALVPGSFRVVSRYHDLRTLTHDFTTLSDAKAYADDVASEWDEERPTAVVFDGTFTVVYEGKPYYAK